MATTRTSIISDKGFRDHMVEQLQKDLEAAAEPYIQEALKDAERRMRKQMAAFFMGVITKDFDFQSNGHTLTVRINQGGEQT